MKDYIIHTKYSISKSWRCKSFNITEILPAYLVYIVIHIEKLNYSMSSDTPCCCNSNRLYCTAVALLVHGLNGNLCTKIEVFTLLLNGLFNL